MGWRGWTDEQRLSWLFTLFLPFVFLLLIWLGYETEPEQTGVIVAGVLVSAALWLGASIHGMWEPRKRHMSGVLNSIAASAAAFAGLAALSGF